MNIKNLLFGEKVKNILAIDIAPSGLQVVKVECLGNKVGVQDWYETKNEPDILSRTYSIHNPDICIVDWMPCGIAVENFQKACENVLKVRYTLWTETEHKLRNKTMSVVRPVAKEEFDFSKYVFSGRKIGTRDFIKFNETWRDDTNSYKHCFYWIDTYLRLQGYWKNSLT